MVRFIILLFFLLVFCVACLFFWDMYTKATLTDAIHRDLGFELVYVEDAAVPGRRVKRVDYVAPDGIFAKAGFVEGDVIVDDLWRSQFYRWLHRSRGTDVTIHVVRGGDGLPRGESEQRALTFAVPDGAVGSSENSGRE